MICYGDNVHQLNLHCVDMRCVECRRSAVVLVHHFVWFCTRVHEVGLVVLVLRDPWL